MSSMATFPLARRPAELPAPCWAGVARKPSLNGSVLRNVSRSSPAVVKQESLKSCVDCAFVSVSGEQSLRAKLYHQWAAGHLSPAPTEMGTMPADLSVATSSFSSSRVVGGAVIPACANRSLLYQKPSMP